MKIKRRTKMNEKEKLNEIAIQASKDLCLTEEQMIALSTAVLKYIDRREDGWGPCTDDYITDYIMLYLDHKNIDVFESEIERIEYVLVNQVLYPFIDKVFDDKVFDKEGDYYLVNENGKRCLI